MGVRETKWVVTIDGNAKQASAETVDALKKMATEYETNKKGLDQLNSALKASGKGNAEVTKSIKAQIEKLTARQAVLTATAAKHGQSVQTITKNARKEAAERENAAKKIAAAEKAKAANQAKAFSMVGGRLGSLRAKLLDYQAVASEEGGGAALLTAGLAGLGAGAAAAAVAIGVKLASALASASAGLVKWIMLTTSSRLQTQLQMQAWVKTSENARNLADQVDELRTKVPLSTDDLSKLAITLRQAGMRGPALVDSLNAVGQASAALGDEAGAKIQEFITRYQRMGVMQINPIEMADAGIDFDEVAKAYASGTKKSIEAARRELLTGQAKLGDGAAAMNKALTERFGAMNLRKQFTDLSKVSGLFGDRLSALMPKGAALDKVLEPVGRFVERIYNVLDPATESGKAIQKLFSGLAEAFGTSLDKNGDWIEYGIKEAIIWTLELATEFIKFKNTVEDAFNDGRSAAEKFNSILNTVKGSLKVVAGLSILPLDPYHAAKWIGGGVSDIAKGGGSPDGDAKALPAHARGGLVTSVASGIANTVKLPAHASGGMVRGVDGGIADTTPIPAPGEGLASVGVGEMIIPAAQVRSGGAAPSITVNVGDIHSAASDPKEVAREVADNVVEKILAALNVSGAQAGVPL